MTGVRGVHVRSRAAFVLAAPVVPSNHSRRAIYFPTISPFAHQADNSFATGFRRRARVGAKHRLARIVANNQLRQHETIQLVDESRQRVGEPVSFRKAMREAKSKDSDLILLDGRSKPVICTFGDLKKLEFEARKKAQAQRVSQMGKQKELKTFKFKSNIDEGDINRNIERILDFVKSGHRVDAQIWLLRRWNVKQKSYGQSVDLANRIINSVSEYAVAQGLKPFEINGETKYNHKVKGNKITINLLPGKPKANDKPKEKGKKKQKKQQQKQHTDPAIKDKTKGFQNRNKTIKFSRRP